jgi:asparagine synthase (glutamine-hydrolysing)
MCGIAGVFQVTGGPEPARADVARMVTALAHRGPDGSGLRVVSETTPVVALGHTRLAILDLSQAGSQPMSDADGTLHITYNGEIYNFAEVRAALGPDGWRSHSDTEVILRAYARWGADCLHRLRGMFAVAIWDSRRQELFLARDHLGIKPLYYCRAADGSVAFASEVRALLASGRVPRRLDADGLLGYLTYQSAPGAGTLIQDVRMLPPGTWMRVASDGNVTRHRYWDLFDAPVSVDEPATSRARVADLLHQSAALHMVSDVPVAVFLSGGIDSSAIVALVRDIGEKPRTFSVGFAEQEFDETQFAEVIAQRFDTEHTPIRLSETQLLQQLPEALEAMDQPTGDGINTFVVARAVRAAGIKVALSGLGGDELFGGYPSFGRLASRRLRAWLRLPKSVRQLVGRSLQTAGGSSIAALKTASLAASDGDLASLYAPLRQVLLPDQRTAVLEPAWAEQSKAWADPYVPMLRAAFSNGHREEVLGCVSYAEARTYMHDVLLRDTDQLAMAHALEVRVPLLDHVLAEYVVSLPDTHKRPDGTPKRLLVESLDDRLPTAVTRRRKQGFTLPLATWMRGELKGFCEERLGPRRLGGRGIFQPERLKTMWDAFLDNRPQTSWSRVWVLVVLEDWLERNGF